MTTPAATMPVDRIAISTFDARNEPALPCRVEDALPRVGEHLVDFLRWQDALQAGDTSLSSPTPSPEAGATSLIYTHVQQPEGSAEDDYVTLTIANIPARLVHAVQDALAVHGGLRVAVQAWLNIPMPGAAPDESPTWQYIVFPHVSGPVTEARDIEGVERLWLTLTARVTDPAVYPTRLVYGADVVHWELAEPLAVDEYATTTAPPAPTS